MNLKTAYLLLIMILCPISLVNSQTSVCELAEGQMCVSYSYLRKKAVTLSVDSKKEKYIGDNVRIGLDYGITDSFKFSMLPDIRIVSNEDGSVTQIAPAIGVQGMLVSKPLPSFLGLSVFGVLSAKFQYSRLDIGSQGLITDDDSIDPNLALEGILGFGASRKIELFGSVPFTFFTEGYYEGQFINLINISSEDKEKIKTGHSSWLELGAEVKIWDDIILIPRFRMRVSRKDSAININFSDEFFTMTVAIEN